MKRLTVAVLCCQALLAQAQNLTVSPLDKRLPDAAGGVTVHHWNDGPLTWNNFTVKHVDTGNKDNRFHTFLEWRLAHNHTVGKQGNIRYYPVTLELYSLKEQSWYDPTLSNDWSLRFNQTEYDMVEVIRREYQNALMFSDKPEEVESYYRSLLNSAVEKYEMETGYGQDTAAIVRYENLYRQKLDEVTENPVTVPDVGRKCWGLGAFGGYRFEKYSGDVGMFYTPMHGFEVGFRLNYSRLWLAMDVACAIGGEIRQSGMFYDDDYGYLWRDGYNCKSAGMGLQLGFNVIDGQYVAIAPFAGWGFPNFSQKTNLDRKGSEVSVIYGNRLIAGLSSSVKLRRIIQYGDYSETNICLKAYYARTDFPSLGTSGSFNLSVLLDMPAWATR